MCDFLLTLSLLLSLAGLLIAMSTLAGSRLHDGCIRHEPRHATADVEAYGQNLVATYLGYRQ